MQSYLAWREAAEQGDNEPPDIDFCYNCHTGDYQSCNIEGEDGSHCGDSECPTCQHDSFIDCEDTNCYCSYCNCITT